jgi:hypothetical protein
MLNRVRVDFGTKNNESILNAIPSTKNGKETKEGGDLKPEFKWTEIDSFCCLPLLPLFLNVTPRNGESVNVIFPDNGYQYDEQYYIQGSVTSPLTVYNENFNAQRMFASKNRLESPKLLRNPLNNEYYISKTKGVFIEPEDIGLMGRGTSDIVVKDRHVLLRAGKSTTIPDNPNKEINAKPTRSFIQLSDFGQREVPLPDFESTRFEETVVFTKTLIEWNVTNPENAQNKFNYDVSLYRLPDKKEYNTQNITIDSDVLNEDKALIFRMQFLAEGVFDLTQKIIKFIGQCNDGEINIPPYSITKVENQFPLFFRPAPETLKYMESPSSGVEFSNITAIGLAIDYKSLKNGTGLIFAKDKLGQQFNMVKDVQKQKEIKSDAPITYNITGADKLLFLSHESRITGKQQITLDETTIYGIEQSYLVSNVIPNTDPMVRGDELMKFMNLVVRFLSSHVHAFHGLPPVPVAQDGTNISDILQKLATAPEIILNQNIRIN